MKNITSKLSFLLAGILLSSFNGAKANDFTVVMGPTALAFNPSTLTINQGDTITWTNAAAFVTHTTTSGIVITNVEHPDSLWNNTNPHNTTFTVNFTGYAPKTYPYFCVFHATLGMVGFVTVNGTVQPPTLANSAFGNSQFQLSINGLIGQTNVIETSPDLFSWSPVSTNMALSSSFNVTNLPAAGDLGFYRVRLVP